MKFSQNNLVLLFSDSLLVVVDGETFEVAKQKTGFETSYYLSNFSARRFLYQASCRGTDQSYPLSLGRRIQQLDSRYYF